MFETINRIFELARENKTFFLIVIAIVFLIMLFSLAIIFHKIRQKFWKALIPIYNVMVLLSVLGIPIWMVVVLFIPFVNFLGVPFLLLLIGWRLGQYCHKGIFMRLGLMLCPPLFFPILATSYINIDGEEEYEPVEQVKEDFSLNAVEVEEVKENVSALSLNDVDTISQIAPPIKKVVEIPKKEPPKKESKDSQTAKDDGEDVNAVLPTADDLTFDYNSLYQNSSTPQLTPVEEKEEKKENEEVEEVIEKDNSVNYDDLYEKEEEKEPPVEEVALPVIHDIVLEDAEEVDDLAPIPINKRYDYQRQTVGKVEEKIISLSESEIKESEKEKFVVAEVPETVKEVIEPASIQEAVPEIAPAEEEVEPPKEEALNLEETISQPNSLDEEMLPQIAAAPDLTVASVAEIEIPDRIEGENTKVGIPTLVETPVESPTRIDQIMSMNIAEPNSLPVGVLPTEKEPEVQSPPVEQVAVIPQTPVMQVNPTMTREEAMGFRQRQNYFFNTPAEPPRNNQTFNHPPQPMMQQPVFTNGYNGNMVVPNQSVSMPYPQQQKMAPNNQMMQPNANGNMMVNSSVLQQNPTAIFQVNSSNGGSLLRPVESGGTQSEKSCPVCGVKLKQDCPICIMCGYRF